MFINGSHNSGSIVPTGTPSQPGVSAPPRLNSAHPQRVGMKIFTFKIQSIHFEHTPDGLLRIICYPSTEGKRLHSCRWHHKGAVPEEQQWHQTTPAGTHVLSAPAQPCRTGHSSSISLYRHSLGDVHTGTEMDFLGPGTLTSEVLLQCHHQILVCSSSRNLDCPQIPVTQDFQENKINNLWHPLSLVSK